MTPRELIEAFEVVADAPEGVKRLRELVLSLAVRGRLVQPHAGEWRTVPLTELTQEFQNGTSSRGGEGGQPVVVLRLADIKQGRIVETSFRRIDLAPESATKYGVREGDVLAIRVNGSADLVGRLIPVQRSKGWCYCDHLIRIRLRPDTISPRFLTLFGDTNEARSHLSAVTVTTAGQKTVNQKGLGSLQVPVPPLEEQHRIVARVDELMALLDRLETARTTRDEARSAARDSALADLRDAPDAEAAATAWSRIARNMDDLFTEPEDVAPLRQAILQLAVWGRLVEQNPHDEPVQSLIEVVRQYASSIGAKVFTGRVGALWPVPTGWQWVPFGCTHANRDSERIPLSREERSTRTGTYDYYGASGVIDQIDGFLFNKPLLLIGEDGANLVLRSTPIAFMASGKYWVNNHAHVLDSPSETSLRYLAIYINAIDLRPFLTGTAQPKLNQAKMNSIPCPLPPLAEQHRIVAKVDALMALCDDLEARLTASRALHGQLAAAAVHHLDM